MTPTMSITPAHLQRLMEGDGFESWKHEVAQVKELYRKERFKRCATLCETLQQSATHPIQKAYLYFLQAVCYQSLGTAAHQYSSNKIPILELAKESYMLALYSLPLQPSTSKYNFPLTPATSPTCAIFDILNSYDTPGTILQESSPCPAQCFPNRPRSTTASSTYSNDYQSIAEMVTPCVEHEDIGIDDEVRGRSRTSKDSNNTTPTSARHARIKARLSQSLSETHVLVDELVPSPLFRDHSRGTTKFMPILSRQLPQTLMSMSAEEDPSMRPLPPLPFNHQPKFLKKGNRHILVIPDNPMVQNLVSKYEDNNKDAYHNLPSPTNTPITPRFTHISNTFEPSTAKDNNSNNLTQYHSTISLTRLTESLISFRTQITSHITEIETILQQVTKIQEQHKSRKDNRLVMSFWSFTVAMDEENNKQMKAKTSAKKVTRQDRIARLRAEGWTVKKERHGWKGQEYYDWIKMRADSELRC